MADEARDAMDELLDNEELELDADELETDVDDQPPVEESDDEPKGDDDDKSKDQPEETDDDPLAKIEALTKEKAGLYREMIAERQQRQELKQRVDAIAQALSEAKANRAPELEVDSDLSKPTVGKIPVKFDDEGNPYLDPSDLKGLTAAEVKAVKDDIDQMKSKGFSQDIANQNAEIVNRVFSQDERYPEAAKVLEAAYKYLDARTGEIMANNGMTIQSANFDQVLDLLDREYGKEFSTKFPGMDIDVVVEAMTQGPNGLYNQRKISRALKSIVASTPEKQNGKKQFDQLRLMASKPSSLAGQRNQKGSGGRSLNDIAEISVEDFENMSDADVRKIERALGSLDA